MKASFENSVSVLVRAYMNDTLVHSVCTACAVGNLVAAAMGTAPLRSLNHPSGVSPSVFGNKEIVKWDDVFCTIKGRQVIDEDRYNSVAKKQIDATGYSWEELARIEYAFETAPGRLGDCDTLLEDFFKNDEWMFNGLMAVVDVLADIHGVDLSVKETAIGQFKEVQALKLV